VFSTAQYPFGIQLQDKLTGKVVATFNARSDADQQKFVTDLEECIAEQAEMELAKSVLNDENFLNQVTEDNAYETLC
jgi:predicted acyl esterase